MRTGRTRFAPQMNSVSGAVGGTISIVAGGQQHRVGDDQPALRVDQHLQRRELRVDAQRWWRVASPFSSWSVASISTSTLIVSSGGPVSRCASERAPSPPAARGLSVRVSVSGLYWNTITFGTGTAGSIPTSAPLSTAGELGKVVMDQSPIQLRVFLPNLGCIPSNLSHRFRPTMPSAPTLPTKVSHRRDKWDYSGRRRFLDLREGLSHRSRSFRTRHRQSPCDFRIRRP